jgi:hypothetical protein
MPREIKHKVPSIIIFQKVSLRQEMLVNFDAWSGDIYHILSIQRQVELQGMCKK